MTTLVTTIVSSQVELSIEVVSSEIELTVQIGGVTVSTPEPTQGSAITASAMNGTTQRLVFLDPGNTGKLTLADATVEGKEAIGYIPAQAFSLGDTASFRTAGKITGLSGLTPGQEYFMTTTPGVIGLAPSGAVGSGIVVLPIGTAISATEISFAPGMPVTL